MSEKINTPLGKMSKKEDLIWGIVIFIFGIGYGLARFFSPESDKLIDTISLLGIGILFGIFCCVYSFLHPSQQEEYLEFDDVVKECFKDIDAEKKNYKGSWFAVEEWKREMQKKVDELKQRTQTEELTDEILEAEDNLIEELDMGLAVIQDGNNPLTIKEGKGREPEPLSPLGKIVVPLLVILPGIFLYLVLSGINFGIFTLTMAFPWFLFKSEQFKFRYMICVLLMGVLGYFLNQWTYAQSGEVQIAVTLALPIIYAIIYYKLKHKKEVREI